MSAILSGAAHMPLPIWAWPGRPAGQADIDVPVLVGLDPGLRLHVVLADHGAGFHRGVDLVAGAVEEAGVDEHDALRRVWMQALRLTVVRRSSSMMPTLMVFSGSASSFSTRPNNSQVSATSSGPCIFGLTI